jgi:hypothetical protein
VHVDFTKTADIGDSLLLRVSPLVKATALLATTLLELRHTQSLLAAKLEHKGDCAITSYIALLRKYTVHVHLKVVRTRVPYLSSDGRYRFPDV